MGGGADMAKFISSPPKNLMTRTKLHRKKEKGVKMKERKVCIPKESLH